MEAIQHRASHVGSTIVLRGRNRWWHLHSTRDAETGKQYRLWATVICNENWRWSKGTGSSIRTSRGPRGNIMKSEWPWTLQVIPVTKRKRQRSLSTMRLYRQYLRFASMQCLVNSKAIKAVQWMKLLSGIIYKNSEPTCYCIPPLIAYFASLCLIEKELRA